MNGKFANPGEACGRLLRRFPHGAAPDGLWMKVAVVALLLVSGAAQARRSKDFCPELPPDSGIEWQYLEGGDFIGCVGLIRATGKRLFHVYIGQRPDYRLDPARWMATGRVGGHPVQWQSAHNRSHSETVLEAHLLLGQPRMHPPLQSVVEVYRSEPAEYRRTFRVLSQLRYRTNWVTLPPKASRDP
jgi:hypothetical protein